MAQSSMLAQEQAPRVRGCDDTAHLIRFGASFEDAAHRALVQWLSGPAEIDGAQLSANPVLVTPAYLAMLDRLSWLLNNALTALVTRYFDDARIRAIYNLPQELEALLRLAHGRPFQLGWVRPDVIHDTSGHPRVCEIGARYPLNGWMVSNVAAQAVADSAAQQGLGEITGYDFIASLCAPYRAGQTLAMIHGREAGTEVMMLRQTLAAQGVTLIAVQPDALRVEQGELSANGHRIDHSILVLDRSELLQINAQALSHLIDRECYFNDIRTIILVHDKRVLAALWHQGICEDLIGKDAAQELRRFLIPSWTVASAAECDALLALPQNMIVKRSSGGRGIDALVRSGCNREIWQARVRSDWGADMYQDYLPQYNFGSVDAPAPTHLVGLLLCHNGRNFGPGVFRGSDAAVINLHGTRGLIHVPLVAP